MRFSILSIGDHYPDRPRSVAGLYGEAMRQCVLAERLGYEAFFTAEHHFHEYGAVPDPAVLLAAMAARTSRIRLGTAISVLPFRNPLTVAESYAMVDMLSGGRLVLGVGSGYLAHEFEGFGVPAQEKRGRFDEALAVLRLALAGGPVAFDGHYHKVEGVRLNVAPVQRPVPIHVAVLRPEAAWHVGKAGNAVFCVPYASVAGMEDVAALFRSFAGGRAAAGLDGAGDAAAFAFHTFVAETDREARETAAAAFERYVATRLYARRQTWDDIMASGLSLMGSVETVAEKLRLLAGFGLGHVLTLHNFGGLAPEAVERSMRLFAEEALPRACAAESPPRR